MTKEELEKEAEKYFKSICEDYNEEYERTGKRHYFVGFDIKNGYLAGAEPREKQIQIDAEQIRALQRQNGELIDKVKELERKLEQTEKDLADYQFNYPTIKELEEELEQAKKVKVVEHFEAYGQCRDSRRIAELEAQIKKMRNCANCKNYNSNEGFCVLGSGYGYNCNLEKWEIKER